jgi:hypothetical protein
VNDDPHYRNQEPSAKTEAERLEAKRESAGYAFEMNHPPLPRSRIAHFGMGLGAVRMKED